MSVNAPRWIYGKPELVQSSGTTVSVRWVYGKPVVVHEYAAGAVDILPSGIQSAEAVGAPAAAVVVAPTGIVSAEAFGTPSLPAVLAPTGIASLESLGAPALAPALAASGIASAEAFGTPEVVAVTDVTLTDVGGIASAEAVGTPTVAPRAAVTTTDGLLRPASWPFQPLRHPETVSGRCACTQPPQTMRATGRVVAVVRGKSASAQHAQTTRATARLVFAGHTRATQPIPVPHMSGRITTPTDVVWQIIAMVESAREREQERAA